MTPKITLATTLGDLALIRAKYAITRITVDYDPMMLKPFMATMSTSALSAYGRGDDEAEAMDDALARIVHRIGDELRQAAGAQ